MVAEFQASDYNSGMSGIIDQFMDLIFPPRCIICKNKGRSLVCGDCAARIRYVKPPICRICGKPKDRYFVNDLCGDCAVEKPPFITARSIALYEDPLKEVIHKLKFGDKMRLLPFLGGIMNDHLKECGIDLSGIDLIIPVPLSKQRERQRGFNQSRSLAKELSDHFSIELDDVSLKKVKDITPQFELPREQRLTHVKGAFESAPIGGNILLIDDIYTTGATVREASLALRSAGADQVFVLTLARAVA